MLMGITKLAYCGPFHLTKLLSFTAKTFLKKQYGVSKTLNCLEECLNSLKNWERCKQSTLWGIIYVLFSCWANGTEAARNVAESFVKLRCLDSLKSRETCRQSTIWGITYLFSCWANEIDHLPKPFWSWTRVNSIAKMLSARFSLWLTIIRNVWWKGRYENAGRATPAKNFIFWFGPFGQSL